MKRHASLAAFVIAGLFLVATCARGVMADDWSKDDQKKDDKAAAGAKPGEAAGKSGGAGEDKAFDDVVKDMEVVHGLFTFYRKADENKTLMEIAPAQMDSLFLFASSIDQSLGERGFYGAQQGPDFPIFFHRVGKTVQWMLRNTSFAAPEGSPAARTVARSFANGILGSAKLLSKPHPERKSVLIDTGELFATRDFPGFAATLSRVYQPTNFSFDKERSAVAGVKAFPENVLINVNLHYQTDNARTFSITLADARSVPISVRYEISTLRQTDYKPRLADDRVGHFLAIQQDLSTDEPQSPYVRRITRWNLQKADPNAALSPPKQPIVYWLENTIPLEYREPIRDGILLWNKAFEKIGIQVAIVVKQQPDSGDWDAADTRYSTIRWFAGVDATFAIGPSRANPFTGEIYDADVSISEGIVRYARRFGEEFVGPSETSSSEQPLWMWSNWSRDPRNFCDYADGLAQQGALGLAVMEARGELTPELEKKFMDQYVIELTAHEVGHTLGLRHNFRGSSILSPKDLNDVTKTHELGQSASVMDYNPVIIAAKGEKQGDFVTNTLGPYDYWAIEYAYQPIQGDEQKELAAIAARGSSDPMLPYSTDEDALGTYSPASIDPLANQYDASNAPMEYFRRRLDIVHELWGSMEANLAKPGDGYQVMRRALGRGMAESYRSLMTTTKLIGGIHHRRDHVGDPGGHSPFTPVPAAQQREALDFLSKYAFSDAAFRIPASLQNKLAIERIPGLDAIAYYNVQRIDYPWHDAVLSVQRAVLARLLHPITLARVLDNELRFPSSEKAFHMVDLFNGLNAAIWSELDTGESEISSTRRNLQREYLNQLIRLTLRTTEATGVSQVGGGPPPSVSIPEDATTLARASLVRLQTRIRNRGLAKAPIEATTRAHLQETQARITAALDAQMQRIVN